jgi:hypothetical protein
MHSVSVEASVPAQLQLQLQQQPLPSLTGCRILTSWVNGAALL